MNIISHRGFWKSKLDQNSINALAFSFESGFGVETDIRDYNGNLVISHDLPNEKALSLEILFKHYNEVGCTLPLALNVKSDGLQIELMKLLNLYNINNYFVFDMSIPDFRSYASFGFNTYFRLSEYESDLSFYSQSKGIWLDSFDNIWYDRDLIVGHINSNKQICIVSDELHRRNHINHWNFLLNEGIHLLDNITLCTDFPELAKHFFYDEE
jgi:hypothetical protein